VSSVNQFGQWNYKIIKDTLKDVFVVSVTIMSLCDTFKDMSKYFLFLWCNCISHMKETDDFAGCKLGQESSEYWDFYRRGGIRSEYFKGNKNSAYIIQSNGWELLFRAKQGTNSYS